MTEFSNHIQFIKHYYEANASAYIFICRTILARPFERVGDRFSRKPIASIKCRSASAISFGESPDITLISRAIMPLVIMASLSARKVTMPPLQLAVSHT